MKPSEIDQPTEFQLDDAGRARLIRYPTNDPVYLKMIDQYPEETPELGDDPT